MAIFLFKKLYFMTVKQYFAIMLISTILCWVAWFMIIKNIAPETGNATGFAFFYASLFLALLGTLSIISFAVRRIFNQHNLSIYHIVQKSFRDAILFSLLIIIFLYLLGIGFLRWWNVGILLIGVIFYLIFVWTTNKTPEQIQN